MIQLYKMLWRQAPRSSIFSPFTSWGFTGFRFLHLLVCDFPSSACVIIRNLGADGERVALVKRTEFHKWVKWSLRCFYFTGSCNLVFLTVPPKVSHNHFGIICRSPNLLMHRPHIYEVEKDPGPNFHRPLEFCSQLQTEKNRQWSLTFSGSVYLIPSEIFWMCSDIFQEVGQSKRKWRTIMRWYK